ncbi:winged helix-turn-helix domain-containing protein [Cronobacter turicensis]
MEGVVAGMYQKVYILNAKLIFWPDRNLLSDGENETKSIHLTAPASRCLELLITRNDLVLQKELYEHGWAGSGFTPSPNTLYQSISLLRRAFRELDESKINYILTETRRGFRINPEVTVTPENRHFENIPASESLSPDISTGINSGFKCIKSDKLNFSFMLACIITSLTLFTYLIFLITSDSFLLKRISFDNYKIQKPSYVADCIFFLAPDSNNFLLSRIDQTFLSCKERPFNYITSYSYSSNISVISCDKEINASPDACRVLYLRGKNDN